MFCPYSEQETTMQKILNAYTTGGTDGVRQAHLLAQMQSGKSGIFLGLAVCMIHNCIVDRVIIVCGSNENELHEQLLESWKTVQDLYAEHPQATVAVMRKLQTSVTIYKSTGAGGIKKIPSDIQKTLVIWDEAHFAQDLNNLPAKYMRAAGLLVSGTEKAHATWASKDCYFLSVSATPFAAVAAFKNKEFRDSVTHAAMIWHEPSASYKGVYDLQSLFRESYPIKDNVQRFKDLLATVSPRTYILVRSLKSLSIVQDCCRELGIQFIEYTASTKKNLAGGLDSLKDQPAVTTVIGLKGMCRMGKVVPKRYIGMTFEESQTSNTDSLLQSFVGRMCGHDEYPTELPLIFLPKKFFTAKNAFTEMDRYIRFAQGEEIVPERAAHVAPAPSTLATRTGQYSIVPFVMSFREDEDEYGALSEMSDLSGILGQESQWRPHAEDKALITAAIQRQLTTHPLTDDVQQSFLTSKANVGCVEFHNIRFYPYALDPEVGIEACATNNCPFDDKWTQEGKYFKVYRFPGQVNNFYISARTETAGHETVMEQKNAMPMAEPSTIFRCDDIDELTLATVPATTVHPVAILSDASDFTTFLTRLRTPGIHTAYIHSSLRNCSEAKELKKREKTEGAYGRKGKYLPKSYKKEEYPIRITIEVKITIDITITCTQL